MFLLIGIVFQVSDVADGSLVQISVWFLSTCLFYLRGLRGARAECDGGTVLRVQQRGAACLFPTPRGQGQPSAQPDSDHQPGKEVVGRW